MELSSKLRSSVPPGREDSNSAPFRMPEMTPELDTGAGRAYFSQHWLAAGTKPKAWLKDGEPRAGLDVVADHVLTAYHLKRKRAAMAAGEGAAPADRQSTRQGRSGGSGGPDGLDDGNDDWLQGR